MEKERNLIWPLMLSILIVLMPSRNLYAYIDLGTGSYILQILIATIVGGAFAIRTFWKNIKDFFNRKFSKKEEEVNGHK